MRSHFLPVIGRSLTRVSTEISSIVVTGTKTLGCDADRREWVFIGGPYHERSILANEASGADEGYSTAAE